jgi:hypothetical protein
MKFLGEGDIIMGDAHTAATAASDSLDDDRIADLASDLDRFGLVLNRAVRARDGDHAGLANGVLGDGLVAHDPDALRFRADELDVTRLALFGEFRVLG